MALRKVSNKPNRNGERHKTLNSSTSIKGGGGFWKNHQIKLKDLYLFKSQSNFYECHFFLNLHLHPDHHQFYLLPTILLQSRGIVDD